MTDIGVVGIGCIPYGKYTEKRSTDLFIEASVKAFEDAGISPTDVDAVYFGNFLSIATEEQGHQGQIISSALGVPEIPTITIENACASGGMAFRQACLAVESGAYDLVLVGGAEIMTHVPTPEIMNGLAMASEGAYEKKLGLTFPGLYALIALAHMEKHGTTSEQLASVAVKNHRNAAYNPTAQFQREISLEKALNSPMIAEPLRLFDCCPITDGASAVIIGSKDRIKSFEDPVWITGAGQASDFSCVHEREDITAIRPGEIAAKQAYKSARISEKDVDLAEVHDCFTIAEIIATEGLGFFGRGGGGRGVEEGETVIGGRIPVNTSGGLKAKGHPVGATGVGQVVEAVEQLRGEAGKRQVEGAETALTHNVGGSGSSAVVHIFQR